MKTRILLVDDHELMRQGLRSILEGEEDVEIVGEASSGREAVSLARKAGNPVEHGFQRRPGFAEREVGAEVRAVCVHHVRAALLVAMRRVSKCLIWRR